MSRELTLIERMGVEFEERDGLFYPLVDGSADKVEDAKTKDIGKYGHLWINFMQEAYQERYRSLVRFGLLKEKAVAEKYVLRTQVRMLVEEIVMREVVNIFH